MTRKQSEKALLRKEMRMARASLGAEKRLLASAEICRRLIVLPQFLAAGGVHLFASLPEEVGTEPIFEACWNAKKTTFVPYQIGETGRLGMAPRGPNEPLFAGPFQVPEPAAMKKEIAVSPTEIDLVLVPGLAFDRSGGRLGYGKGFYDLFLAEFVSLEKEAKKKSFSGPARPPFIGLAFQAQIVPEAPKEAWDIKMDGVLTEEGFISAT